MIKKLKCSTCKTLLPATKEYFYHKWENTSSFQNQCRDCDNENSRRRRAGEVTKKAERILHALDSVTITRAVSAYRQLEFDIMRTEESL